MGDVVRRLAEMLGYQARSCRGLGSPLYEILLDASVADVEAGGPVLTVLEDKAEDPDGSALAP